MGGLQRPRRDVAGVRQLGLAGGGDDGIAGTGRIAYRLLKAGEIHRLPDDVLHLPAGFPEQVPAAHQQVTGGLVGHRLDTELRIAIEQAVVHVSEQHGVASETIGGGKPALASTNQLVAVGHHALDQHQLTGRYPELLGRFLGGGHGHHQVVADHEHTGGDAPKAHQRTFQLLVDSLPGRDRFELASQVRPLLVQLRKAHLDIRRRRP